MVANCFVPYCSNRHCNQKKFHCFPKDPARRNVWKKQLEKFMQVKREPRHVDRLCGDHFDDNQYKAVGPVWKLKKKAVPTIFSLDELERRRSVPSITSRPTPIKLEPPDPRTASPTELDHDYLSNEVQVKCEVDEGDEPDEGLRATARVQNDAAEVVAVSEPICEISTLGHDLHKQLLKVESQKAEIKFLNARYDLLQDKYKRLEEETSKLRNVLCFLEDDQKNFLSRKTPGGVVWSEKTIKVAMKLRQNCGLGGYETLLQHNYPLPSVRTLQRRIELESGASEKKKPGQPKKKSKASDEDTDAQ